MDFKSYMSDAQVEHLYDMSEKRPADWQNKNGAPTKHDIVKEYRKTHPNATRYACARATGLSINTVKKWWNSALPREE